jgi:flavin reductase (DIM6/NTAB) family NADH-FMN oxidoreductase RutF
MKEYIRLSNDKAYKLLNSGALILVSSFDKKGQQDIAPIAWNCPVNYDPGTKLLFISDLAHKTYENIKETKKFVISVPHISQLKIVKELGCSSGHDTDKISKFNLKTIKAETNNCAMPEDCIAYIECDAYKLIEEEGVAIVFGDVKHVSVDKAAFSGRLLSESEAGKTIHHLGGKVFISTGNETVQ